MTTTQTAELAKTVEPEVLALSDTLRLYHELQIHQVELELQNEELKRAKDEIDAMHSERQRIYRALSHDLAQPVLALRLFVKTLIGSSLDAEQRRLVLRIQSLTDAFGEISAALSSLSHGASKENPPTHQTVALAPLLEQALNCHLPVAAQKGLRTRLVPTQVCVATEPAQLARIVGNLISNAVHFTTSGSLLIGVRRSGRSAVRIEVRDTGIGIDKCALPHIFDEFYQVGNVERIPEEGLGLGLAIAKRLADDLGLTLSVRSTPGRGSVFSVTIPVLGNQLIGN